MIWSMKSSVWRQRYAEPKDGSPPPCITRSPCRVPVSSIVPVCPTVVYRQNEGRYNRRAVAVVITLIVDAGMMACRLL